LFDVGLAAYLFKIHLEELKRKRLFIDGEKSITLLPWRDFLVDLWSGKIVNFG